jgi:hypothetical protein
LSAAGNPYANAAVDVFDPSGEVVTLIKDQLGNFIQYSKHLMAALDEVAKFHPFLSGRLNIIL